MSDRLFALRLFARVARKGSFSAAGRELGVPQSTASRTIATLEREMGVSLPIRATRALTLTEAGADGSRKSLAVLLDRGSVILTFYRGGRCPQRNLQLRTYQQGHIGHQ